MGSDQLYSMLILLYFLTEIWSAL